MKKNTDSNRAVAKPGYKVGHGQPPLHSRFVPGQSGNPKGRPKGTRNLASIFRKIMNEKITLREGDRVWLATKFEAMMRKLSQSALKGDAKAIATVLAEIKEIGAFEEPTEHKVQVRFVSADRPFDI